MSPRRSQERRASSSRMARAKVLSPQSSNCRARIRKISLTSADAVTSWALRRILEPLARGAAAPAAPVVGVPRVIDPCDQVRLPLWMRPVAAQDPVCGGQNSLVLLHVLAQRVQITERAAAPASQDRLQHPFGCRVPDHDPRTGGPGFVQHRVGDVRLDDDDPVRPPGRGQLLQHGHGHRVKPGEHRRVADRPRPQPAHRLAP